MTSEVQRVHAAIERRVGSGSSSSPFEALLEVGFARHTRSLGVSLREVRADLVLQSVDELAQVAVERESFPERGAHVAVRLRRAPESVHEVLLAAFGRGPLALRLARSRSLGQHLEPRVDLGQNRLLSRERLGQALLVRSELFELGRKERRFERRRPFAIQNEDVRNVVRLYLERGPTSVQTR